MRQYASGMHTGCLHILALQLGRMHLVCPPCVDPFPTVWLCWQYRARECDSCLLTAFTLLAVSVSHHEKSVEATASHFLQIFDV